MRLGVKTANPLVLFVGQLFDYFGRLNLLSLVIELK